jgi:hypothetical protein
MSELNRVKEVTPLENYRLLLKFTNGEKRLFDAKPILKYKCFEKLKNKGFFRLAHVAYGTVIWTEDVDYCPDCLYIESKPVKKLQIKNKS